MRSHQSRAEGQNYFCRPPDHATFDAAQHMVGFLGCECTLVIHVHLFIHQKPQVLLSRVALNLLILQPVLILWVALTQVQDAVLAKCDEVHTGPFLELVRVPLDGIPSPRRVNLTTQLAVICILAEGAHNPDVYVIDEDIKWYLFHYGPRGIPLVTDVHLDIEPLTTTLWM